MPTGRYYTAFFNDVTITAAQDLFELVAASTCCTELLEIHLSQQTEIGDAMEEMLNVVVKTGATTTGSGGTTPTAVPLSFGDAAAESTTKVNNTTKATAGTIVTHQVWWWNVRVPFDQIWTPDTTIVLAPSRRLTVELVAAPADTMDVSGWICFKEVGGA
jgi:hypothetical protein